MVGETKYLTDRHVLRPIIFSFLIVAFGVALWVLTSGKSQTGFWVGLVFVLLGVAVAVSNALSSCWYPVMLDNHVVLEHFLFRKMSRVIRYEDILYAKVAEFKVRLYYSSPVLTIVMKDGKRLNFTLMTKLEQVGSLARELRGKGVPDTFEMPVSVSGGKVYCSKVALAIFIVLMAAMVAGYVTAIVALADPMIIVVTIMFVPLLLLLLNMLSYIVVGDGRIMLKYMIFRSRNLDIDLDDAYDVSIGGGSHLDVLLRTPDKGGKSRYTRIVGLISTDMIQEINVWLKSHAAHIRESE